MKEKDLNIKPDTVIDFNLLVKPENVSHMGIYFSPGLKEKCWWSNVELEDAEFGISGKKKFQAETFQELVNKIAEFLKKIEAFNS